MPTVTSLIDVQDLQVHYQSNGSRSFTQLFDGTAKPVLKAVDGASFSIRKGEILGLVGESGCGKSTTGRAILRLVKPTAGKVLYLDRDLAELRKSELRSVRRHLQMIFQDPYSSLNPRMTVGAILREPLTTFALAEGAQVNVRVRDLLEKVGLNPGAINSYPHEFSGGQRQRIGIARALATQPEFIVADEPIAALDVSIQAQVMNLLKQLRGEMSLTFLFISHDLRAVRYMADRVAVMYMGKLVEIADAGKIYRKPLHPYTQALISAVPIPNPKLERERQRIRLKGDVPSASIPPQDVDSTPDVSMRRRDVLRRNRSFELWNPDIQQRAIWYN